MRHRSINSSDWSSWHEIIIAAEIAAALLVLCIIAVEWLVTLSSLYSQATVR